MDKNKILRIVGVAATAVGAGCLYFAGASETQVATLVGGVFVFIGIVIGFFKVELK